MQGRAMLHLSLTQVVQRRVRSFRLFSSCFVDLSLAGRLALPLGHGAGVAEYRGSVERGESCSVKSTSLFPVEKGLRRSRSILLLRRTRCTYSPCVPSEAIQKERAAPRNVRTRHPSFSFACTSLFRRALASSSFSFSEGRSSPKQTRETE